LVGIAPDGSRLVVQYQGRDDKMYTQADLWLIDTEEALAAAGPAAFLAAMRNVSAALNRELRGVYWVNAGLYTLYPDGTQVGLAQYQDDGAFTRLDLGGVFPLPVSLCCDIAPGGTIALVGANAQTVPEAHVADATGDGPGYQVTQLTNFGAMVEGWELGSVETIRWTSRDGTEIEGVLHKPTRFDPARRYLLVFVVHGGPSWFSPEFLVTVEERGYYPSAQFVQKDELVLKPNCRGSIGRGQAFRELNVGNLGIGDLWDLESAIDHLEPLGWVDRERVGCM
jgi:dipeptidyl aminopeptidase/acylaminoacyl peptidase